MYKYQCSKDECGSGWTLQEGSLNGFVLTCPICGKGRGIFVSQDKGETEGISMDKVEQMTISMAYSSSNSIEKLNERVEELKKSYSLNIIDKDISQKGNEVVCRIKYQK